MAGDTGTDRPFFPAREQRGTGQSPAAAPVVPLTGDAALRHLIPSTPDDTGTDRTGRIELADVVLSCAVRYALGRHTYLPGLIADEVRRCWPELGSGQRDVIRSDITRWLADTQRTDWSDITEPTWVDLLAWILDQEDSDV